MIKKKRTKFKYNLILLNESTLEEVFRIKTSKLTFSLALGTFTLVSFTLLSIIIFITPLKHMLPGYADVSVREDVIIEAQRIDSLETLTQNNERQLLIIKNIIADNISIDSIPTIDSTNIEKWNTLPLIAGTAESEFVKQYEEENAFNIGSYNYTPQVDESMVFIAPAIGTITQHFSPNKNNYSITIVCPHNTPVLAPQDGHIILTDYNINNGYTIIIQHADGYLSIFHHLGTKLCNIGAIVKAGEAIAFVGTKDKNAQDSQFQYELWQNGIAINPEENIIF
jgi:lipoprotein NlpD